MSWRLAELPQVPLRFLASAALLALTPKCAVCLLAYAGLGAALGLGGPEICGGAAALRGSWMGWFVLAGTAAVLTGWVARARFRRNR